MGICPIPSLNVDKMSLAVISRSVMLLIALSSAVGMWAVHPLINRTATQGGRTYDLTHIFIGDEPIRFSLADPRVEGKWTAFILGHDKEFHGVNLSTETEYDFYPQAFKNNSISDFGWYDAHKSYDPDLNRNFYTIRVAYTPSVVYHYGARDTVEFKLALGPTRPVISNVKYSDIVSSLSDNGSLYLNGMFSFDVESEDATSINLGYSNSHSFGDEDTFAWFWTDSFDATPPVTNVSYNADWGEFVTITAKNEYETIRAEDTLLTTDYITDEEILDYIKALEEQVSVDNLPAGDDDPVSVSGGAIRC